ncbi:RidA family protein [Akkermansia sp.]|uniref:RidA family protein n=1 Tax=Akkermansia sp. TaxID=1872421 RepID=UPI0025BCBBEC|nr:RidA family protein [Akkermansia sp.]MCD8065013.1 RidA family protein [Akkermansia sp.]
MDKICQRLSDLGYAIYDAPAPVGSYVQCVRTGNLLHLSGGISVNGEDKYFGKVGQDLTVEEGQDLTVEEGQAAARAAILNRLAVIVQAVGSLEKVSRIVAVNGFVNAGPDFYDHPKVLNGASDLLVEAFGEIGRHSRTAVGVSALPLNVAVEISMVVEVCG